MVVTEGGVEEIMTLVALFIAPEEGAVCVCVCGMWPDLHVPVHIMTVIFRIVFKMAQTKIIVYCIGFRIG